MDNGFKFVINDNFADCLRKHVIHITCIFYPRSFFEERGLRLKRDTPHDEVYGVSLIVGCTIKREIAILLLDSLIYKGTPDYFYLIPLYSSVDLKDVFAFLGAGCILSIISTNEKNMQKKTTNMEAK